MDLHRASGHVQWLPESFMRNFLFLITHLMFHVSFKSISDSRQCIVSQRRRRGDVVCRSPKTPWRLQPPRISSPVQCMREDMASHTSSWHTQSILCITRRFAHCLDFNVRIGNYLDWNISPSTAFYGKADFLPVPYDLSDWRLESDVGVRHNATKSLSLNVKRMDNFKWGRHGWNSLNNKGWK